MAEEWWRGAAIYQIAPRGFQDTDGDGVGDLAGILRRMPYVASLGVDAVWITPFFRSPMADFGYDVSDYRAVDPLFGTMEDFDRLLAEAHRLGLKVLIDMVWSHSSDRHPWFADSRASRTGAKADWYVWADPRPDGTPPNNWLSVFGGGAWTWEPRRRQYYLHHFLPSQPALNWRCPAVAEALLAVGEFWLAKGVDGFRLDAVDFLMHDPALPDNPPRAATDIPNRPFAMQRHLHDMAHPDTMAVFARIRALMDRFPGTTTVAELSSIGDPVPRAGAYTDGGDRLHKAYSLELMRRPLSPAGMAATIAEVEARLGGGWLCWAFSNHDIERAASRWGDGSPASARALLALLAAMRGSICLYQGEELGLPEAEVPFERLKDPFGLAFWPDYKGRDGCRTPMPWTRDGGFSTAEPWLPIPPEHRDLSVAAQEADPASTLATARRLLALRKSRPALRVGALELVDLGPGVLAFERRAGADRLLCVFNLSAAPVRVVAAGEMVEAVGAAFEDGGLVFPTWGAAFIARA